MARWQEVEAFVRRVLCSTRRSQQTTAAALLDGLLRVQKIGLTTVACGMIRQSSIESSVRDAFARMPGSLWMRCSTAWRAMCSPATAST